MKANPDMLWSHMALSPPKGLDTSPGSPKAALRAVLPKGSDKRPSLVFCGNRLLSFSPDEAAESELLHVQMQSVSSKQSTLSWVAV